MKSSKLRLSSQRSIKLSYIRTCPKQSSLSSFRSRESPSMAILLLRTQIPITPLGQQSCWSMQLSDKSPNQRDALRLKSFWPGTCVATLCRFQRQSCQRIGRRMSQLLRLASFPRLRILKSALYQRLEPIVLQAKLVLRQECSAGKG